jgi:hypothetical protein
MPYFVKQYHRAPPVTETVPVDESLPRACVIGAGSSGIAAAKQLYLAGVPFDCFCFSAQSIPTCRGCSSSASYRPSAR